MSGIVERVLQWHLASVLSSGSHREGAARWVLYLHLGVSCWARCTQYRAHRLDDGGSLLAGVLRSLHTTDPSLHADADPTASYASSFDTRIPQITVSSSSCLSALVWGTCLGALHALV